MMRRFLPTLALTTMVIAISAAPASAAFGLKDTDVTFTDASGSPALQAGGHPDSWTIALAVNGTIDPSTGGEIPDGGQAKDLAIEFPPGLVANPTAVPRCSSADFLTGESQANCPDTTAVGIAEVMAASLPVTPPGAEQFQTQPVYNLIPSPGTVAKFGFYVVGVPITVEALVNDKPPYNAIARVTNVAQAALFFRARTTLWGNPASPLHDAERGKCAGAPTGTCPVSTPEQAFTTVPRSCSGPAVTTFKADSWASPGSWVEAFSTTHDGAKPPNPVGFGGCSRLAFAPHVTAAPTASSAESPTGLNFNLDVDDEGLTSPDGIAQSDIKRAVVTLPPGVTANPSLAEGLLTCSEGDLENETIDSAPGQGCPQASKVGTVEVETPLLEGTLLNGQVFIATQNANPFHSLLALYMVIKEPKLGILVKLPGKVEPNLETGQLVTTFGEAPYEIPQFPFSHLRFHFREGGRSPLVTPAACGEYQTKTEFTPWSGGLPTVTTSSFKITSGVNGGPCPAGGTPPFKPGFEAGAINNNAGAYSPYYLRLTRRDGDQDLTKFSIALPPGSLAKLAGVSMCSDTQIAAARVKTGVEELASSSCPASSQIGTLLAGAGVGPDLTYVPGKVFLAGPYNGASLSIVAIVPAVAGPFDIGTVVTRQALTVDPETGEARVDGSRSDPIPRILAGIPLKVRDIRVYVDRPDFTLNPTSCDAEAFKAQLWGAGASVFSATDEAPVSLATRFQAANCANLNFKPKLSLKLTGGTKRSDHPALKAVVNYPPGAGYANIAKAVVTLPHSMFLDQSHIRTICTRVQFAAHNCPAGSIYGHVKATTPLLEETLEGPVYLRSSSHPLPDVVFALHGLVDLNVVTRIDSSKARVRASIESVPDAPVSQFVLEMQGGNRGLFVNSRDLCARPARAVANLEAHNGKIYDTNPVVANSCSKKKVQSRRTMLDGKRP
jgi:hypothetical protein